MPSDKYRTITAPSEGEFKDRGSRFLAYAFPADSEERCVDHLNYCKKLHPKARHHCYAYRLGFEGLLFRANDDGEPSGTAGRPILGQIDSFELTNVIIIVIRYFGGTKLGTSGLINAYKLSTAEALGKATIIEKQVEEVFRLDFDYALMGDLMNAVKKKELTIVEQCFEETASIEIAIRKSEVEATFVELFALIAKVQIEEAQAMEHIDGLRKTYLYTR